MITAGSIKANSATIYGPRNYNEFAVVKVGSVFANNDTDLQTAYNLYMDWDPSNFYYHYGAKIDNSNTYMRGLVYRISKWTNEDNSTFTIPRGDCTGTGYHDTSSVPSQDIPGEPAVWTYAFEDTPLGDYDMNDVVIRVNENAEDENVLDVTLCATGAAFNLNVYLDDKMLFAGGGKEVHRIFGHQGGVFINTVNNGIKEEFVTTTITKPANFSYETADFWIKTPYMEVHVAKQGQDPHGIVVPGKWRWPREAHSIKDAYPNFIEFAKDASTTDETVRKWYQTTQTLLRTRSTSQKTKRTNIKKEAVSCEETASFYIFSVLNTLAVWWHSRRATSLSSYYGCVPTDQRSGYDGYRHLISRHRDTCPA